MSTNPFLSPQPTGQRTLSPRPTYAPPPGPPPSQLPFLSSSLSSSSPPSSSYASPLSAATAPTSTPALTSSSTNPFVSPQPTSVGRGSTSSPPRVTYAPPPGPPPPSSLPSLAVPSTAASIAPTDIPTPNVSVTPADGAGTGNGESGNDASRDQRDLDSDIYQEQTQTTPSEPPPPYTFAPDAYRGEETIQYGPRRPFQPAPPPLRPVLPPRLSPSPQTQQPQLYNPPPGSRPIPAPNSYTNGINTSPNFPGPSDIPGQRPPPPRHPSTQLSPNYASHPARRPASYSGPSPTTENWTSMPGSYAPPPGPLPRPQTQQQSQSPPPVPRRRSQDGSARSFSPPVPDDGKPTRKAIPGHPYMLNGQVLVYPPRHTCHKCLNIGYKNLDITHPCRKCWEKYGRPYEGSALAYADWTDRTSNFQRPLPQGIKIPSITSSNMKRSPSFGSDYPGAHARAASQSYGSGSSSLSPPAPLVSVNGPPPPGALVVMPGDPRIGGRLCYNCGGDGLIPAFLFFSEETCPVCSGTGRIL